MASMFGEGEGQLLGRTQRILLELSTVLYFTAKNSAIPLVQQYIYFLVGKKYAGGVAGLGRLNGDNIAEVSNGHYHNTSTDGVTSQPQYDRVLADRVNEESSLIILYLNMAELLPAAIVVLLLGFWSDLTGKRKFLMWLPCIGNAVYALGFLLPLYICDGNIDSALTKAFFVVASIVSGLSGSVPGFLSGNASYISDTDTRGRRTLRLAIVELSIGMTFGLSNLLNGFWIRATQHYEQPLWFVFGCSVVPFFLLFFCLKEPNGELTSQLGQPTAFKDFRAIRNVFGCSTVSQKKLWAIFIAFQIYVFVQQGQERTFVLFLQNSPLYWKSLQIGLFLFVLYALSGLGCWPGVPLLHRVCDDVSIAIIAMISKAVGSFILAFARNDAMVYLSSVVQLFHLTPYAVARSMASKEVGESEQGSVYALLHSVQSVAVFLGPLVHNAVFAVTLHSMSGLVFLVSGPVLVVPVLLLVWIKHKDRNLGYFSMEGANAPQPLTPTMTPLSEVSGFAQRPPDYIADDEERHHVDNPP